MKSITLSKTELTSSVLKQYRWELLKYHVELVELFNKYYIVNYNPQRPYRMHMFPPVDAVDGLVFGEVDLSRIKDKVIRDKYESELKNGLKSRILDDTVRQHR